MMRLTTLLALAALLIACDDAGVEYRDRDLNISLTGCLGEVTEAASGAGTCRGRLNEAVAAADINGCFLVRQTVEGSEVHGLPLRWSEGRMAFVNPGMLPLAVGQQIEAEVYVFREGVTQAKCAGGLSFGAACDDESACLIKLIQAPTLIGEEGLEFDFGAASGKCHTEGPLEESPEAEVCDGADNDCDGEIDEGDPGSGEACDTGESGICADGLTECTGGAIECRRVNNPSEELCGDGLDNNCDGQEDEGITWRPSGAEPLLIGAPCALGVGACRAEGVVVCDPEDNKRGLCDAAVGEPTEEICDHLDNDCDERVDEDFDLGVECTTGQGICMRSGLTICAEDQLGVACDAIPGEPELEQCDGLDNDCDEQIDEDFDNLGVECERGIGGCRNVGEMICAANGADTVCSVTQGDPVAEICGDSVDNNCDGIVDEGFEHLGEDCQVGIGACVQGGVFICDPNAPTEIRCSAEPSQPAFNDVTCDGVDDDCDGEFDEDFQAQTTRCGVGACEASGELLCEDGDLRNTCQAGSAAENDATCDGEDDDCDGEVDEDYDQAPTSCGIGACASTGNMRCEGGVERDTCVEGEPAADDAICDGIDSDCDTEIDEDFVITVTECGFGACATTGFLRCEEGAEVDTCIAGDQAPNDPTCDGRDDDCDTFIDEDYVSEDTTCGVGACRDSGRTFCVNGEVVDSCEPGVPAPNDDTCDGVDDDCDGLFDEDFVVVETGCGEGACASTGQLTCQNGQTVDTCVAGNGAATDTTCDGVDDDCDGRFDEEYQGEDTACGVGVCASTGRTFCVNGEITDSCRPLASSDDDPTCDGRDDDCDGEFDEDFVGDPTNCGVGACARAGTTRCEAGSVVDTCMPGVPAASDATCDGVDDDCDGIRDEDFQSQDTTCGVGECAATGRTFCVNGAPTDSCEPGEPADDDPSCDGRDDDCDDEMDEDFVGQATSCGVGACADDGETICQGGRIVDTCQVGQPAPDDETCDGVDDDCDGLTDEDFVREIVQCGEGSCGDSGQTICVAGVVDDTCAPGVPAPDDATCDGVDDDCDGQTDEDYVPQQTTCGVGACASTGWRTCVNGEVQNSCVAGDPAPDDANCNTVDDDCNGEVDEDFPISATSCGQGPCARVGLRSCEDGRIVDSCVAGQPAASDESCDGVDNDCDGAVDEEYVSLNTSCGVGECVRNGQTFCVNGQEQDSCTPGQGTSDANCDGRDNDCDGSTDEGYISQNTTCGVGACVAGGVTICTDGEVIDNCTPGQRLSHNDRTCDNIDDDCDGLVDDDYRREAVVCGEGSCGDSGETICVNGVEEDTCQPGVPAPNDSTCDGVDDDCDGVTDEDYPSQNITCGLGICQANGTRDCVNGVEQDDCTPLVGQPNDPTCDGDDDDCDGQIDEDYSPTVTNCGQGVCESFGVLACQDGSEVDTCTPGAAGDELCGNQLDDDCDGNTDEGFPDLGAPCQVGEGICLRDGVFVCSVDRLSTVCSVVPGPPDDNETCDDLDNDCDGEIDEGNPDGGAACVVIGVDGECQNGEIQCTNGALDCIQVFFGEAEVCDLLDNDCDGVTDNDLGQTTCGLGICENTIDNCVNGVPQACDPMLGAVAEDCFDGLDNDCDGDVDGDDADCA